MLQELIEEAAYKFSLLIKDSTSQPGWSLMSSMMKEMAMKGKNIISVQTEPEFGGQNKVRETKRVCAFKEYDQLLTRVNDAAFGADCYIVFPSISLYLMNSRISQFASLLRGLQMNDKVIKVVCLVHSDVLPDDDVIASCEYLFDAMIDLLPVEESELSATYQGHVKCLRRKPSGKLETSDEFFSLNQEGKLDLVHTSTSAAIRALVDEPNTDIDVTNKLTFNLTLSDRERQAKNSLQLPYLKKESEKKALLSQVSG